MAGTSLVTLSRWLAAGYEIAPQGRDWLDPDDEYGKRGPIYPVAGARGPGGLSDGADIYGDLDTDPDEDRPVAAPPVTAARVWRTGAAWDALVKAGGFQGESVPCPAKGRKGARPWAYQAEPETESRYDWSYDDDD